jgi:hypothetical protein
VPLPLDDTADDQAAPDGDDAVWGNAHDLLLAKSCADSADATGASRVEIGGEFYLLADTLKCHTYLVKAKQSADGSWRARLPLSHVSGA